jgi:hypothetical protein
MRWCWRFEEGCWLRGRRSATQALQRLGTDRLPISGGHPPGRPLGAGSDRRRPGAAPPPADEAVIDESPRSPQPSGWPWPLPQFLLFNLRAIWAGRASSFDRFWRSGPRIKQRQADRLNSASFARGQGRLKDASHADGSHCPLEQWRRTVGTLIAVAWPLVGGTRPCVAMGPTGIDGRVER